MNIKLLPLLFFMACITGCVNSTIIAKTNNYLVQPTGEYGVGYRDIHWINYDDCPDVFYNGKNSDYFSPENELFCSELLLRIYYPIQPASSLVNLHLNQDRQGPGSEQETLFAAEFADLANHSELKIADIGCGTGSVAMTLAKNFTCHVTAVDIMPAFVDKARERISAQGLQDKVSVIEADMMKLPFEQNQFDVMWSEGAIYNIGFQCELLHWRNYLKPGGMIAISDLTWLTAKRPENLTRHWRKAYSSIGTAGHKIKQIEDCGFKLLGYFPLKSESWESYYRALEGAFPSFLEENNSSAAHDVVNEHISEMELYRKHSDLYSYGFYVAQKVI